MHKSQFEPENFRLVTWIVRTLLYHMLFAHDEMHVPGSLVGISMNPQECPSMIAQLCYTPYQQTQKGPCCGHFVCITSNTLWYTNRKMWWHLFLYLLWEMLHPIYCTIIVTPLDPHTVTTDQSITCKSYSLVGFPTKVEIPSIWSHFRPRENTICKRLLVSLGRNVVFAASKW